MATMLRISHLLLCALFSGTTATSRQNKRGGGKIYDSSGLTKAGNAAAKKWLAALMATTSRRKGVTTLDHKDKGVHSVVGGSK